MNSPYGLPAECLSCVLRPDKFFCALSEESVQAFRQTKHAAVYPEDAIILVEGQSPHGIFILCQGQAKLSPTSRDGKTIILRIVSPAEVLGLHAVVSGKPSEVTVETMQQPTELCQPGGLPPVSQRAQRCLSASSTAYQPRL
jgi:CRP/FNR family cyclic AMP-dependent transcriptional regulator